MKIDSYSLGMDSARTFSSSQTRKLSITMKGRFADIGNQSDGGELGSFQDALSAGRDSRIREINKGTESRSIEDVREKFVLYLWQIFFGKDKAEELRQHYGICPENSPYGTNSVNQGMSTIEITGIREVSYSESESLSFTSNGSVTCEDGSTINFNLNVNMSRQFETYYREEGIALPAMVDPLVINFSGDPAELSDQTFTFDLDNDGNNENISYLGSGSGYLALDLNNDGSINNGSELFGTSSGDGFTDLSRYDSDHNGWIDENDEVFDKLKIWVKDANGNDSLYSLKEKNVGAIYLGSVKTDFTMRSANTHNINGAIRQTGIFLYEDGSGAGTVNHLDVANLYA